MPKLCLLRVEILDINYCFTLTYLTGRWKFQIAIGAFAIIGGLGLILNVLG
ncbi:MAG: hypothetical protein AB1724_13380 [Thermodesulfobacteriota bacterium]